MAEKKKEEKPKAKPVKKAEPKKEEKKVETKKETPKEKPTALKKAMEKAKEKAGIEEEKKPEEKKILKESIHVIPLRKAFDKPRSARTRSAIQEIKKYILKHTRKKPVIGASINHEMWANSIGTPPRKLRVKLLEEEDRATAELA